MNHCCRWFTVHPSFICVPRYTKIFLCLSSIVLHACTLENSLCILLIANFKAASPVKKRKEKRNRQLILKSQFVDNLFLHYLNYTLNIMWAKSNIPKPYMAYLDVGVFIHKQTANRSKPSFVFWIFWWYFWKIDLFSSIFGSVQRNRTYKKNKYFSTIYFSYYSDNILVWD